MSGHLLLAVSQVLLAVFAVGFLLRTLRLARMPVHLRWELAPVPRDAGRGAHGGSRLEGYEWWKSPRRESRAAELRYVLAEVLLLKALRKHNRRLWRSSYPFHLGFYLLTAGALLLLAGAPLAPGAVRGILGAGITLAFAAGCCCGAAGGLGLLAGRLLDPALAGSTTPGSVLNLLLALAVFATGGGAILSVGDFGAEALGLAEALLKAPPPAEVAGPMAAHVLACLLFLAVLPFGPMMHFVAKYFAYHQVRWEDRPLEPGGPLERELRGELGRAPGWAAPHVGADGRRTWADIATGGDRP